MISLVTPSITMRHRCPLSYMHDLPGISHCCWINPVCLWPHAFPFTLLAKGIVYTIGTYRRHFRLWIVLKMDWSQCWPFFLSPALKTCWRVFCLLAFGLNYVWAHRALLDASYRLNRFWYCKFPNQAIFWDRRWGTGSVLLLTAKDELIFILAPDFFSCFRSAIAASFFPASTTHFLRTKWKLKPSSICRFNLKLATQMDAII